MTPAGAVIALAVCFVVMLLAQKHGRRIGYDQGITDRVAYCRRVQRLQRERDEAWTSLDLTLDAFDRQRDLAERRFAELVEAEHARDSAERRRLEEVAAARIVHTAATLPTRIVSLPRGGAR